MPLNNIDFPDPAATPFTDDNGYTWDWDVTKWVRRTQGIVEEAPIDGEPYVRKDAAWVQGVEADPEALDILYVRRNGGWYQVVDVGSGITDAPSDGTAYLRKDAGWSNPVTADFPDFQTSLDGKADLVHDHVAADVTDLGAMATTADAPDASSYLRTLGGWVPYTPGTGLWLNQGITVINPQATDDGTILYTGKAITLQNVAAHIVGTTNVVFNIYFASARNSGAPTKVFTSDVTVTSEAGVTPAMNNTSIPINSWVWVEVVSVLDTPDMFHASFNYTQD